MPTVPDDSFDFLMDGGDVSAATLSEPAPGEVIDAEFTVTTVPNAQFLATPAKPQRSSSPSARPPLYFDIETIPDFERLELFGLPAIPEPVPPTPLAECPDPKTTLSGTLADVKTAMGKLSAPPEWLDALEAAENTAAKPRAGVFDLIRAARGSGDAHAAALSERNKLLSTTPEFCRVAALGWAMGVSEPCSMILGPDDGSQLKGTGRDVIRTEKEILEAFWILVGKGATLIGFNCLSFDLPVLFVRSAILGVLPSRLLDLKPWGKDVTDLYHLRFGGRGAGTGRPGRLKDLARIYGLDVPAGDVDGSQVLDLWRTDPLKVGEYVRSDIAVTRGLHRFYQGLFCL